MVPISVLAPENPQHVEPPALNRTRPSGTLILQNPASRFSAILWLEDAVGQQLAILDSGAAELPGPWRKDDVKNRFWSGAWSGDVTLFSWSPGGEEMVVQTSDVYNEGGIYLLDLYNRRDRLVGSIRKGGGIERIDWSKRLLIRKNPAASIALPAAVPRAR